MTIDRIAIELYNFHNFLYNAHNVVVVSGKEPVTDTLDRPDRPDIFSTPSLPITGSTDITLRLQTLISTWKGAQNGLALETLHEECVNAVGTVLFSRLLPAQLVFVHQLDATTLQRTLQHARRGRHGGQATTVQFRVPPSGRFDAALVPTGKEVNDRYLLALDDALSVRDQVALYGHAVGHLLLNYQEEQLGHLPDFSPRNGYAHADTLAELRFLETTRQNIDRRVLNTFEPLRMLLDVPQESRADFDTATADLQRQLVQAGWGRYMEIRYQFTDGRISTSSSRRGTKLSVDALLRAAPSLPIAIVHRKRAGESYEHAVRVLHDTAQRMALPFAYLLEQNGSIQEFDWSHSSHAHQPVVTQLDAFPAREALFVRWTQTLQLTTQKEIQALRSPYHLVSKKPRYYQEAAINQAIIAVLQARRGLCPPRLLLTLATGTGKTKVAFQLLWKLKRSGAVRNVLFLTDRDFLVSQAMDNEFAPFGDARYRLEGQPSTAYDVNFALYQSIVGPDHDYYLTFPADFFEVIVIDECHRGSAQETSEWRKVLTHFSSAVQIGLTATPLSTDTVQTDEYFGSPLYQYSLQLGINDGFLAPYRVRRVLIDSVSIDSVDAGADSSHPHPTQERDESVPTDNRQGSARETVQDDDGLAFVDIPASMETAATMRRYTKPIAQHLAAFLQRTDPYAKTIVFCVDQAHAEDMRLALLDACASWMPTKDDYVVRVVADEKAEGKRALGNFTTPDEKFPVIVTTSKLLSTGVDVPTCKNIVLARPVGSLVEFKQIIGRGTRLFPPQKSWFTILDYAGTIKHFFDPDFDGDPEDVVNELLQPEPVAEPAPSDEQSETYPSTPVEQGEQGEQGIQQEQHVQQETIHASPIATSPAPSEQEQASEQVTYQREEVCSSTASVPSEPAPYSAQEGNNETPLAAASDTASMENQAHGQQHGQQAIENAESTQGTEREGETHSLQGAETTTAHSASSSMTASEQRPVVVKQLKNGRVLKVVGEVVYELDADGRTLRRGTYRECAIETTAALVSTPQDLRSRWLHDEQRHEIIERLQDEGVDLDELAYQQGLMELDPLDLLLHVVFHEPKITRQQRVERLRRTQTAFFARFEKNLLARAVLDVILEKYVRCEAPDVSDVDLLPLLSLADKHTPLELAQAFVEKDSKSSVRSVLKELQRLLYSV